MMLKRRQSKQHQAKDDAAQKQQEVTKDNNTGNDQQQQIECIIPAVISAPTDAASQQEMLRRTHHTRSLSKSTRDSSTEGLSATQIAFLASDENGVVVTSNRYVKRLSSSSRKLPSVNPASFADTDDTSTLPTFVSVGDDIISWQQTSCLLSSSQGATSNTFLVSKDNDDKKKEQQQPPLLTLVSLEAQNSRHDREDALRKKLHYKTKLRSLTDQLTASSAVEQSRKMLSPDTTTRIDSGIVASPERSKQVKMKADSKTTNNLNDCCVGDSPLPNASASDSKPQRILSGMYKALTACTTSLCLDDTVVNHEGTIIEYPTKKKKSLRSKVSQAQTTSSSSCMCAGDILHSKERSQDSGSSDDITDISSLTGMTPYRYQKKHWMHHYDIHESEMTWV